MCKWMLGWQFEVSWNNEATMRHARNVSDAHVSHALWKNILSSYHVLLYWSRGWAYILWMSPTLLVVTFCIHNDALVFMIPS